MALLRYWLSSQRLWMIYLRRVHWLAGRRVAIGCAEQTGKLSSALAEAGATMANSRASVAGLNKISSATVIAVVAVQCVKNPVFTLGKH